MFSLLLPHPKVTVGTFTVFTIEVLGIMTTLGCSGAECDSK